MSELQPVKCKKCHKLLFKADGLAQVEIVCRHCSALNRLPRRGALSASGRCGKLDSK